MAVTFTSLDTNSDTTNQTTAYSTASVTPTASQPVLVAVLASVAASPTPTITVSGCGLTWTQIDTTVAAAHTAVLFLGIGASPTTGAISIAGDGVITTTSCMWSAVQCAGVDTTTNNGVVQHISGKPTSSNSISVAFTGTVVSTNGTYGMVGTAVQESPTGGSGWTSLGSINQAGPTTGLVSECQTSTAQQNITASWTTASTSFVVGAEMAAAAAGGSTAPFPFVPRYRARFRAANW